MPSTTWQLVCSPPNPVCHTLINFAVHFSSFQGSSLESLSDHVSSRTISVPCDVWFVHSDLERSFVLISSLVLNPFLPRICNAISVICTGYSTRIVSNPHPSFLVIMTAIYIDLPCYSPDLLLFVLSTDSMDINLPFSCKRGSGFFCSVLRTGVSFSVNTIYWNAMDINLVDTLF